MVAVGITGVEIDALGDENAGSGVGGAMFMVGGPSVGGTTSAIGAGGVDVGSIAAPSGAGRSTGGAVVSAIVAGPKNCAVAAAGTAGGTGELVSNVVAGSRATALEGCPLAGVAVDPRRPRTGPGSRATARGRRPYAKTPIIKARVANATTAAASRRDVEDRGARLRCDGVEPRGN